MALLTLDQLYKLIVGAPHKFARFLRRVLTADVYDIVDAVASDAQGLVANFSSAAGTRSDTSFVAGGVAAILAYPRNITVTTGAGGTPTQGYTAVVLTGTDIDGNALTETISSLNSAGTFQGNKAFKTLTSAAWSGGTGAGATQSLGFGNKFGLPAKPKERGGLPHVIAEKQDGATPGTAGTLVAAATGAPYGTYSPNTAPNGARDYTLTIEMDPVDATLIWPGGA
jgi:hypothetical protein